MSTTAAKHPEIANTTGTTRIMEPRSEQQLVRLRKYLGSRTQTQNENPRATADPSYGAGSQATETSDAVKEEGHRSIKANGVENKCENVTYETRVVAQMGPSYYGAMVVHENEEALRMMLGIILLLLAWIILGRYYW